MHDCIEEDSIYYLSCGERCMLRVMSTESSLVLYACVSKGNVILAEFVSSMDQDLGGLALQCIGCTPPYHRTFSHTLANRIYAFLIEDPFVYFAIFDQQLGKDQGFQFLERVKVAFLKHSRKGLARGLSNLKPGCFQEDFTSVFRKLLASKEFRSLKSPDASMLNPNGVLDSKLSAKGISVPLLGNMNSKSKKKHKFPAADEEVPRAITRDIAIENKVDVSDDVNLTRDFSASLQKNGSYIGHTGRHHAKKMWQRHVWTALSIDLVICCILFGVWLYICRGFQCIR